MRINGYYLPVEVYTMLGIDERELRYIADTMADKFVRGFSYVGDKRLYSEKEIGVIRYILWFKKENKKSVTVDACYDAAKRFYSDERDTAIIVEIEDIKARLEVIKDELSNRK